jgi:hypothetical protein
MRAIHTMLLSEISVQYAQKRSHKIPKMSQYEDSLNAHFVFPHVCKFMCMIYPMPYVRRHPEPEPRKTHIRKQ